MSPVPPFLNRKLTFKGEMLYSMWRQRNSQEEELQREPLEWAVFFSQYSALSHIIHRGWGANLLVDELLGSTREELERVSGQSQRDCVAHHENPHTFSTKERVMRFWEETSEWICPSFWFLIVFCNQVFKGSPHIPKRLWFLLPEVITTFCIHICSFIEI